MSWIPTILSIAFWLTTIFVTLYTSLLIFFHSTWVQRFAIYANKIKLSYGIDISQPESFGFMRGQVKPFRVASGGEQIYAWLVTPLSLYARHESKFIADADSPVSDISNSYAMKLLKQDPNSRVVVYFHGNAGTLAEARRTDAYRVLAASSSAPIFILTFDYRGFGLSSGSPTERGVIGDAVSVIEWVMTTAQIPPERILLLAQSLGTAVAAGAAFHFIHRDPAVEFAGVILCAGFYDAATVYLDYSIGGALRVLGPVSMIPRVKAYFQGLVTDTWETRLRVQILARRSRKLRLTFVHAAGDPLVPCRHSEMLFELAVAAAEDEGGIEKGKGPLETNELGEGGTVHVWKGQTAVIRKEIVKYGGHDSIMKWNAVVLAVLRSLGVDNEQ